MKPPGSLALTIVEDVTGPFDHDPVLQVLNMDVARSAYSAMQISTCDTLYLVG